MKKFTFKKTIHEGRYRSFERDHTEIRLDKKEVGYIAETEDRKYIIKFAVKKERTEKDPADFKWVKVRQLFPCENAARQWIRDRNDKIQTKNLNLHFFEN